MKKFTSDGILTAFIAVKLKQKKTGWETCLFTWIIRVGATGFEPAT